MTRLAFNIFNFDSIEALALAVEETKLPVFMQVSVSTVKYLGAKNILDAYNDVNEHKLIQLHLDHCNDMDFIKSCIDVGWHSIMADFSNEHVDVNIEKLNKVRDYLPKNRGQIEGELGSIGGEEDGHSSHFDGMAKLEDVQKILTNADIDLLAIGIGNIHGHYSDNSNVDYEHFKKISTAFPDAKLVLHGATGLPIEKIKELIPYGLEKVNFSTELKDVYIEALKSTLSGEKRYNMTSYSQNTKSAMRSYFASKMKELS